MTLAAVASMSFGMAASASESTTEIKTITVDGEELTVEVTDIGKQGTFTYWSAFTGDSQTWDQWRVDAFNEAYKDLGIQMEVQFVPDGAGVSNGKLLSSIAGGTAPDLVIIDDRVAAYQYAAEGCFVPLDDVLTDIGLNVDNFFEGMKDVMYYDDTCYLIPQDSNVIMLFYNPEIAEECGLDPDTPPTTLEELDAWSEAMTVQADDGSYTRMGIIPWLDSGEDAFTIPYVFGVDPYDAETDTLNLTSDEMVGYLEWVRSYAEKYDAERINTFTSGMGGMFSPDTPYRVCAVPVPEYGRPNCTSYGCNVFGIPSGSENADLAALFIKFCMQGVINEDNFSTWRSIPVIDAEFDNVSLTKNGDEIYALEREIANNPECGIPALCSVSNELSQEFQSLREQIIYNTDTDIPSALQTLQDKMQATMDAK